MKKLNERVEGSRLYASEVLGLDEAHAKRWAEQEKADFLLHVASCHMGASRDDLEDFAERMLQAGYDYPVPG